MPERDPGFVAALSLLPASLREVLASHPERCAIEEIRLHRGQPLSITIPTGQRCVGTQPLTDEAIRCVLDRATGASLHACADALRQGYLTAPGGVRIGVCGQWDAGFLGLREVSSLCLRIPRQIPDAGADIRPALLQPLHAVLILSPPGGGKTTFLRELVRAASQAGHRVSLCDERGEVAACQAGCPQLDVGPCTDVLTGVPKATGAMRMLRAMNPEIIAIDEITEPADLPCLTHLTACGVAVYATAHARDLQDLERRALYREIGALGLFHRAVLIQGRGAQRRYTVHTL